MRYQVDRDTGADVPREAEDSGGVLTIIRGIRSGAIVPSSLGRESRRACVEHLTAEGYSTVEIAEILVTSERTIRRDRAAIRSAHAVERDPALVREMVGHMVRQAAVALSRIRRAVRQQDAKPGERIDAERACWSIVKDLVGMLQKLGYLPTAPVEVRGDLQHRVSLEAPGYDELGIEIERLERIQLEHNSDKDGLMRLVELKDAVQRLALADEIQTIDVATVEETDDD
ncbi:hypothetical protein ACFL09_03790 [Planctomycetota bacterium]